MKTLKKFAIFGKNIEIFNEELPAWASVGVEDRLDNNYYSASFFEAQERIKHLEKTLFENFIDSVQSGVNPDVEGDTPVLEGRNIFPNYVMPNVEKYAIVHDENKKNLEENDILIIKDGSPGVVAIILKPLIEFFDQSITAGEHVYVIRLKQDYVTYGAFITAFLNSRIGQALLRRYITGAISPSIGKKSIKEIPIPLVKEDVLKESKEKLEELQNSVIEMMHPTQISNELLEKVGVNDDIRSNLPINWMPGGKRDSHGYYRRK